jgi:hypothetical protein
LSENWKNLCSAVSESLFKPVNMWFKTIVNTLVRFCLVESIPTFVFFLIDKSTQFVLSTWVLVN